ncbi:MAG TPA: energy transducer TonB [Terriglobales bacterium]|nr:energy transducer TonB [Terriglobales bacterium]
MPFVIYASGYLGPKLGRVEGLGMLFSYQENRRKPWYTVGASFALQILGLGALLMIPLIVPYKIDFQFRKYTVTTLVPPPVLAPPPPVKPPKLVPIKPKIEAPVETAVKLPTPRLIAPRPVFPKAERVIAPEVKIPKQNLNLANNTVVPKLAPQVKTNVFNTGSSATPTVNLPAAKVQTGGFGDPNGVKQDPTRPGYPNIARAGSFDLPAGPGHGNGTGGANGVPGVVASAGFGNGTAIQSGRSGKVERASLGQAGFGDVHAAEAGPKRAVQAESKTTPVEILSKLNPEYTDQARKARIEGEVVLEASFSTGGQVRVLRVVKGLGYGLDESATRAAEKIRFKPAQRDGQSVDTVAMVHVVFQMAY